MNNPTVTLRFIRSAFTDQEGPLEVVASFTLSRSTKYPDLWAMKERTLVAFPTGEMLEVYAEMNSAAKCNYVHLYNGLQRVVSWKASSDVDLMFLLPSGQEAYVSIVV